VAEPRLVPVAEPRRPEGVALVLHGGASRPGNPMVQPTQLSVLRMVPIARRIARATADRVAVYRLLNSHRGWDTEHTPVMDAVWALGQIEERLGRRFPACLVGHSLGGRAALLAGAQPDVVGVVALNPWVYPSDDADLSGRRVLIVHGDADRVALPERARQVADRLGRRTSVEWRTVPGGKHAMLRHGAVFERAAADFVADTLAGPGAGTDR
jgi:pimeloyl-ACP methyl ester carboxylesterase